MKTKSALMLVILTSICGAGHAQDCLHYEEYLRHVGGLETYGSPSTTAVENGLLHVGTDEERYLIIDIENPERPQVLSELDLGLHTLRSSAVVGDRAYLLAVNTYSMLYVIDVHDPYSPRILGSVPLLYGAHDLLVAGCFAYVAVGQDGLAVIDVSDPASPILAATLMVGGQALELEAADDFVYVGTGEGSWDIKVVDVSDPHAPFLATTVDLSNTVTALGISGQYLYVGNDTNGMLVYDIAEPASPAFVDEIDLLFIVRDIDIREERLYSATGESEFAILGISNPASPELIREVAVPEGDCRGLSVSGHHVFAMASGFGISVVSVGILEPAPIIGTHPLGHMVTDLALAGDLAFAAMDVDGLLIVDVSDPGSPQTIASMDLPHYTWDVCAAGNFVYTADWHIETGWDHLYLRVIDVSDPYSPMHRGSVHTQVYPIELQIAGDHVYLLAYYALRIFDVSDPDAPEEIGWDWGWPYDEVIDFAVAEPYIYLANPFDGLVVMDASDPTDPIVVAQVPTQGGAVGIAINEGFAHVGDPELGVLSFDITDPSSPTLINDQTTPFGIGRMELAGTHLYGAAGGGVLRIIDVAVPAAPTAIGSVTVPAWMPGQLGPDFGITLSTGNALAFYYLHCDDMTAAELPVFSGVSLLNAYPNPFNPRTTISFRLDEPADLRVSIHDPSGRLVARIADAPFGAGSHELVWRGRDGTGKPVSSGIYFARLEVSDQVRAQKLVLLR